jgi:hypothetical protein
MIFIMAPAGIPAPVVETLSREVRAFVDSAEFAEKMRPLGTAAMGTGTRYPDT